MIQLQLMTFVKRSKLPTIVTSNRLHAVNSVQLAKSNHDYSKGFGYPLEEGKDYTVTSGTNEIKFSFSMTKVLCKKLGIDSTYLLAVDYR